MAPVYVRILKCILYTSIIYNSWYFQAGTRLALCHNVTAKSPWGGAPLSFVLFHLAARSFQSVVGFIFFSESPKDVSLRHPDRVWTPKDERKIGLSKSCCNFSQNGRRLVSAERRAEPNMHIGPGCRFVRISASCSRLLGDNGRTSKAAWGKEVAIGNLYFT
jgi:hypothetical protein